MPEPLEALLQLIILFFVIVDPLASFSVFLVASSSMKREMRRRVALYAISLAALLSGIVLLFGERLLVLFTTTLDEFRIAGGIILGILGVKMTLGRPLQDISLKRGNSATAIASVIGTPLITGPATITALIVASYDYGKFLTGIAIGIVLLFTAIMLFLSDTLRRFLGLDAVRVISTVLGLITIAWGVKFVTVGVQHIFLW